MGIILDIPLNLRMKDVVHWSGIRDNSKVTHELKTSIVELLKTVKSTHLLEPAVIYETFCISEINKGQLVLADNRVIDSLAMSSLLERYEKFTFVVCTIGDKLEKQVTYYYEHNGAVKGVILDGIGNAAMALLTGEIYKLLKAKESYDGYYVSNPIRPGVASCKFGISLAEHWKLFQLVTADKIGVQLTSKGLMVPLKSSSMVIGIGREKIAWANAGSCATCDIRDTCMYSSCR